MSILQKINAISKEIGTIEKTGRGPSSQGSYLFMKVEDIITKLRPLLHEHGVVVRTQFETESHEFHFATQAAAMDGTPIYDGRVLNVRDVQRVVMRYVFVDVEDGTEFVTEALGEAFDTSDKAARKAETQAYKIALMRTFNIHDGEPDPDSIDGAAPGETAAPKQDAGAQKRAAARPKTGTRAKAEPAAPAAEAAQVEKPVENPEPAEPASNIEKHEQIAESVDLPDVSGDEAEKPAPAVEKESAGPIEETPDALAEAKAALRKATGEVGGLDREAIDIVARNTVGKERAEWIKSARDINKVAAAIAAGEVG